MQAKNNFTTTNQRHVIFKILTKHLNTLLRNINTRLAILEA